MPEDVRSILSHLAVEATKSLSRILVTGAVVSGSEEIVRILSLLPPALLEEAARRAKDRVQNGG